MTAPSEPAAKKAKTDSNGVFANHAVCLVLDYGSQARRRGEGLLPPLPKHAWPRRRRAAAHLLLSLPASLLQYTQLIARRVRENGVLSMLMPGDVTMVRAGEGGSETPPRCRRGRERSGVG